MLNYSRTSHNKKVQQTTLIVLFGGGFQLDLFANKLSLTAPEVTLLIAIANKRKVKNIINK